MSRQDLLVRIRERIVIYGTSRVGREAAEDLAQDTLIVLEQKYAHLDQLDDLLPVAIRTMQFKMRSHIRGTSRQRLSDTPVDEMALSHKGPDVQAQMEEAEFQRDFKRRFNLALEKWGEKCKRLFLLKLEGRRLPEIQDMLGANSVPQLHVWDFRCRQKMRELMEAGLKQ